MLVPILRTVALMARRKKSEESEESTPLKKTIVLGLTCLLTFSIITGISLGIWSQYGESIRDLEGYTLERSAIVINEQPNWIRSNVKAEVLRDSGLEQELFILDDSIIKRIQDSFEIHPWVAKVKKITRSYPANISVELEYRKPVMMVLVPDGVLPVDREGISLSPDDFANVDIKKYPHLAGIRKDWPDLVGRKWEAREVQDAAMIAELFQAYWLDWDLKHIVRGTRTIANGENERDWYYIETQSQRTRIIWGHAPGAESSGEANAEQKMASLLEHVREMQGELEDPSQIVNIDLRTPGRATYPTKFASIPNRPTIK
jgi:hypothetical protein